ncbi:MAG: site-specific integrase [Dethiobacter sp.]|nr:site-specific integrase [Dethiobacter sp.]
MTEDQARTLLVEVAKTRFYGPVFVAIMTGLRRGEVLGLRWSDVNTEKGVLEIRQTVQYTPEQGIYLKAPKTALSNREVSISDSVFSLLEVHRKLQLVQAIKLGELYNKDADLVFCQDNGDPMPGLRQSRE